MMNCNVYDHIIHFISQPLMYTIATSSEAASTEHGRGGGDSITHVLQRPGWKIAEKVELLLLKIENVLP